MSADFWAGYISGAAGILIGNPLDLVKVRLQASGPSNTPTHQPFTLTASSAGLLVRGATAPILGYGALNALLFTSYNRSLSLISPSSTPFVPSTAPLWSNFLAGAIGGLATWIVSTPTELVKCRAQTATSTSASPVSSWGIAKQVIRMEGIRGLYFGGGVTAVRDSVGYGFYFWSYEICTRYLASRTTPDPTSTANSTTEAAKVLLCGGIAGVVTWASIFPLDVIKTRVQIQAFDPIVNTNATSLLNAQTPDSTKRLGAIAIARKAYATEGPGVFFRGLGVCSLRAFVVNAVQWAVYEWIMKELGPRKGG